MGRPLVLIVEDNPLTQETLEQGLTKRGFETIVCGNAEDALEKIKSGLHVPIIILDLKLPGMNGADFSRIIKTDDRWSWISIIPLTSLVRPYAEPVDPTYQDFMLAKNSNEKTMRFQPTLSKGGDEAIREFPPRLIPALVRALGAQNLPVPEGLTEESRNVLDAMMKENS